MPMTVFSFLRTRRTATRAQTGNKSQERARNAVKRVPGSRSTPSRDSLYAVLCGVVGRFPVLLGFWRGGGFSAGVGGTQRDGCGCHQAEGADEQGPLEPGGECLRERGVDGQQMAGAAGRDSAEHR